MEEKIPEQAGIYPHRGIKQVPISDFSNILESTVVLGLAKPPPNNRSEGPKRHWTQTSGNMRFQLKSLNLFSSDHTKAWAATR